MALDELVRYVSRCCARKAGCNLYQMAEKYDWPAERVLKFLRCQEAPPPKMLREIAKEIGEKYDYLKAILDR